MQIVFFWMKHNKWQTQFKIKHQSFDMWFYYNENSPTSYLFLLHKFFEILVS